MKNKGIKFRLAEKKSLVDWLNNLEDNTKDMIARIAAGLMLVALVSFVYWATG